MKIFTFKRSILCVPVLLLLLSTLRSSAQCSFSPNQRTGCRGSFILNLSNNVSGATNTNWLIRFSDGSTTTVTNNNMASKPMTVCGKVVVTMTTTLPGGATCTSVDSNFMVNCPPAIRGTFSTYNTCLGQPVCYNDVTTTGASCMPLTYIIDWQQSPLCNTPSCCKTYTQRGTYVPSVIVKDACGCQSDSTFPAIHILSRPVASFTGAPLSGCATPMTSTMTATAGTATTIYTWYVDGSTTPAQSGHSTTFSHAYTTGVHSVKLVTVDSLTGCSDTMNRASYINVGNFAAACFTSVQTGTCVPGSVRYCPCTPGALSYTWTFPGGTPPSMNATSNSCVNVSYNTPGAYGAQLIVYYSGGCADTMTQARTASFGTPVAVDFTATPTYSCVAPVTVNMNYTGAACASCTFSWASPPNSTPTSHTGTSATLTAFGNYSPILRVTDSLGCISTMIKTNYIAVQRLRAAATVKQLANGCVNDSFLVINTTIGAPFTSVVWNFSGALTTPIGRDTMLVRYPAKGCHRYTLAVQSASGCIDTLRDSICVTGKPSMLLTVYPHDVCYEQFCNNYQATLVPGSDTPTSVTVWPQGLGNANTTQLTDSAGVYISCYMYHDIGSFLPCYTARSGTCLGDTICLTGVSDSVRILAPAAKFTKTLGCPGSNAITLKSTSIGADVLRWNVDGTIIMNQITVNTTLVGPCGTRHIVTLTATNNSTGCVHSKSDTFFTTCGGVDFIANNPRTLCYPVGYRDTARLIYTGTNPSIPGNVVWSGTPNNLPPNFNNPPAAYTSPTVVLNLGNATVYQVCVQLTYHGGCIDTLCKPSYIGVYRPIAAFTVSDTAGCSPLAVNFTGNPTYSFGDRPGSVIWSFGDGAVNNSNSLNVSHTYVGFSSYLAQMTVIDTFGCSATATKAIASDSVVANFAMSDTLTCKANSSPLNPITFSSTSTGFLGHYQWTLPAALGPTNPTPGDVPSFSCQFTQEGSGDVCLIAIDRYNLCRDTICKRVTVKNPVADYSFANLKDTANACPLIVINTFRDSSKYDICSYYWDFGDGTHSDTAREPAHIYYRPGTYPIKQIVRSCHGCTDTIVKYTIRAKGPVVHMTSEKAGGCGCIPVKLFLSSYDADSLQILSDDGTGSFNGTPSFIDLPITRGTIANPHLDTVTITYCDISVYHPKVLAWQHPDDSICVQEYYLENGGGADSIPILIDTPRVNYSRVYQGCGTNQFCFTDQTSYFSSYTTTSQRAWDFGDGSPADSTPTPCHTYATPGDYTVTLSIRNSLGCPGQKVYKIHVPATPQARIAMDDTIGCIPLLLHFRDSTIVDDSTALVSGRWSIGYNNIVYNTYRDTSYNYTVGGNYIASLIVTDGNGCSDTAYQNIVVKPTATLSAGPDQTICIGRSATLSATGSPPLHWEPYYNIDTTNLSAPVVTPQVDTVYIVRAGDVPRCYKYDTVRVNVSVITASQTTTGLCLGQATQFSATAQVTHSTISSYFWDFGDGTTGSGQSVSHSYLTPGTYHDTLKIVSALGCYDTLYNTIVLGDKPHAVLGLSSTSLCLGTPVTVTNNSTPGISAALAAYSIDMQSDGTTEFTTSPNTYTYATASTNIVRLVQSDVNGCIDTATQTVTVHRIPTATMYADTNCIDRPNTLTGNWTTGDGSIAHYYWTINGSAQPEDSAVIHRTFTTPNVYHVCFAVEDVYGCKSPDGCNDFVIIAEPLDTVSPNKDTTICLGYSVGFHVTGLFGTVKWTPPSYIDNPNGTDVVITPRQPMQYLLNVYYGHCTPKVDTVSVYVIDSVPVEATANPQNIVLGLSSNVSSTVKGTIDSIVWDPDSTLSCRTCRNPIATPHQTTTYNATVYYSKDGVTCSNRTSVTVTVITSCDNSLIYIPNTFTPNGDNANDVFRIRGQGITKVNYFRIYDRWGNVVHDVSNADTPDDAAWNGGKRNDRAKPENSGVFVYVFEVVCTTGQTISGKGNVTLIR